MGVASAAVVTSKRNSRNAAVLVKARTHSHNRQFAKG